jgi:hypothetical protein
VGNELSEFMNGVGAQGATVTNKYGTYTVVAKDTLIDAAANNPRLLTISVNGRIATHLFAMRQP